MVQSARSNGSTERSRPEGWLLISIEGCTTREGSWRPEGPRPVSRARRSVLNADTLRPRRDRLEDRVASRRRHAPTRPSLHGDRVVVLPLHQPRARRASASTSRNHAASVLVQRMAAEADIIVENFKTGDLARYGLDYESIERINPGIVYASITGYGHTGPRAYEPGVDTSLQGMIGLMSVTGEPDRPPSKAGIAAIDLLTGIARGLRHPRRSARARQDGARTAHRPVAVRHGHHGHGERRAELHRHG